MADHNYALIGTPSIVLNATATYKYIVTPSLLIDDSTPIIGSEVSKTDGKYSGVVVAQGIYTHVKKSPAYDIDYFVDFSVPINKVNSIKIYYCAGSNYGDDGGVTEEKYNTVICRRILYVKQGGIYTEVHQEWGQPGHYNPLRNTIHLMTVTFDTPQEDVQGIKINAYNPYESRSGWLLGFYITEVQVMGQMYRDIGLRYYDGSNVKKIGVEDLDGHKLRVYDGSEICGIDLLLTDDVSASKIRMFDGSVIKSLPEID